ncbi:NACHT domain-containing protein [Streptomyces sp. NPDC029674]|uniref:NACHT domain-containing protein n=1 Tax=Streptomyces sp. NPDC029674 TaxID=3365297 RepID=UPI00384D8EA7
MSNHVDGSSGLNAPGAVFHGDVHLHLGHDAARPGPHTPGTEQLLLRVVQREFHDGASVRLLDPSLVREHRSVADVFVDLLVLLPSEEQDDFGTGGAPQHFMEQYLALEKPSFRTVLTGGPGQGKTTAVQMLAHVHRAELLRAFDCERLSPRTLTELDRVDGGLRRLELTPPSTARLPLWVEADAFAAYLGGVPETRRSLWHFIGHRYERLLKTDVSTTEVRALARAVPTVLILDGYDEVSPRRRAAVLGHVRDFADDLQMDRADASITVTSRPQAYGNELRPHGFTSWSLTDLSPQEAELHAAVLAGHDADGERLLGLFREAARHGDLPDILNTPLHVALVMSILADSGELPSGRHRLFGRYYDHVYAREEGRGGELGAFLEQHRGLVDELHRRAAFHIIVAGEERHDAGGIRTEDFAALARSVVRDMRDTGGPAEDDEAVLVERLLRFAGERLVLIVGVDSDSVGFQIKSLVEFLAAAHLAGTDDERLVRERFRAAAAREPWRNVARFMAAAAFEPDRLGERDLRDSVVTALAELDEAEFCGTRSLELRGAELAIDLLSDLPELEERYLHHLLPGADVIADLGRRADRLVGATADLFSGARLEDLLGRMTSSPPAQHIHFALWRFLNLLAEAGNEAASTAARAHLDTATPELLPKLLLDTAIPEVVGPEQLGDLLCRADPHAVRVDAFVRRVEGLSAWAWAAWQVMHSGPPRRELRTLQLEDFWPLSGPVALRTSRWLEPLATPPEGCHPNWTAWCEGARAAVSPSVGALDALTDKQSDFSDFSAPRVLPWPVREWLIGVRTPPAPLDARAWHAAEERWLADGVRLHDVATYLREGALGPHVASSGFPFATTHWSMPGAADPRVSSLAAEVWDLWTRHRTGPRAARVAVAERLLLPFFDYGLRHGVPTASARQVREAIGTLPHSPHISYETALLVLSDCPDDAEFAALARRLSPPRWSVRAGERGQGSAHDVIVRAHRLLDTGPFRELCAAIAMLTDQPETWDALVAHWLAPGDSGHEDWPLVQLLRVDGPPPTDRDIALAVKATRKLDLYELAENIPYWSDELRARVRDQIQLQEGMRWARYPNRTPWADGGTVDPLPLALLKLKL